MSDPRADDPPPRVEVRLPDGRTLPARIHAWRQDPDGNWWADLSIAAPAGAIRQLDGQDYSHVPRHPNGPRYVIARDTRLKPGQAGVATIHDHGCWMLDEPAKHVELRPLDGPEQARHALAFADTDACTICNPVP